MAEAEVYDQYAGTVSVKAQKPKVTGISTSKTWKIKSIDASKVPISFNGVELRPVDTAAVLRLVKASKGQISIPGVEIMEDVVAMVEQIREKVRELEHGTTSEEDAEENAT